MEAMATRRTTSERSLAGCSTASLARIGTRGSLGCSCASCIGAGCGNIGAADFHGVSQCTDHRKVTSAVRMFWCTSCAAARMARCVAKYRVDCAVVCIRLVEFVELLLHAVHGKGQCARFIPPLFVSTRRTSVPCSHFAMKENGGIW